MLGSEFAKTGCLCFRNLMEICLPPFGCASETHIFQHPCLLFSKLYLSLDFRRVALEEPDFGSHMES